MGWVEGLKEKKMNNFEDLEIWKLAREICNDIWHFIENSSLEKDYSLKNQMNASSGSIMDKYR